MCPLCGIGTECGFGVAWWCWCWCLVLVLVLVLMLVLVRQASRNDLTPSLLADGRVAFTCINTTQWVVLQNRTCVQIH